jgi:hypothetical protein
VNALLDVEARRVVATRRQLDALRSWASGRGDPVDPVVAELAKAGLLADGVVHPAVSPVVAALGSVVGRAAVRRWCGGRRPIVEVLVGPTGVLVLAGGHEVDAAHDLRWHPRPRAVARVVAEVLGVPAHDGPPVFGAGQRPWAELVAAACAPGGVALADLRWSTRPGAPLASVMVLAWAPDGGVVEVVPVDDRPGWVACRPRHPLDVWTGLTTLCRQVTRG